MAMSLSMFGTRLDAYLQKFVLKPGCKLYAAWLEAIKRASSVGYLGEVVNQGHKKKVF